MKQVELQFYGKETFTLNIAKQTDGTIHGYFVWNEAIQDRMLKIQELLHEEDESWYLDDDGHRLNDQALFEASPWMIVNPPLKVVRRFMNFETGEARFATKGWILLGDYV